MTFIAKILEALAWPASIVLIGYAFRKPILTLLPLIESLRIRDIEVKFRKELEQARSDADAISSEPSQTPYQHEGLNKARELAATHPLAAIIEAWKVVEMELSALAERSGQINLAQSPLRLFQDIQRNSRVTVGQNAEKLFHRLRSIRNEAVHSSDISISEGQALEYVELADSLAGLLRRLARAGKATQ